MFLLSYGPLFYIINRIPFLKIYTSIFFRIYLGIAAVGVVLLLNIIFEIFELKNVKKFLRYLGKFTLEIYVMHLSFLFILQNVLKIRPTKVSTTFIFGIIYIIVSIGLARILNIVLSHIKLPKKDRKLSKV